MAGPAFNAGRYGVACGTICKAVEERLMIPVITGMYEENPGVDMFRKDLIIVGTPNSAAGMPKVLPVMWDLPKRDILKEESASTTLLRREVLSARLRCWSRN